MNKPKLSTPALLAVSLGGAIAVAVLALLLLSALRGGSQQEQGSGGADTPYPYSWAEQRDGSLSVTLAAAPEGFAWACDAGGDAESVTAERNKAGGFTVTPLREGSVPLTFTLAGELDAADRLAELELRLYIETQGKNLKASVTGDRLTLLHGMLRGGEELGCPYRVWNEENRLVVFLTDEAELPDWSVHIADRRVATPLWQEETAGGWRAAFLAGEAGETTIDLLSDARALHLTLGVTSDGETLLAATHKFSRLKDGAGAAAAELAAGSLAAPAGASEVEYGAMDFGTRGSAAAVSFTLDGWAWSLFASGSVELSQAFESDYDAASAVDIFLADNRVTVAESPEGLFVWWTDDAQRSVLLIGASVEAATEDESGLETALNVAEQAIQANRTA